MGRWGAIIDISLAQRGHLVGWVPVCLALGIGLYFSLLSEPSLNTLLGIGFAAGCLGVLASRLPEHISPLALATMLVCIGVLLAGIRSHSVSAPVLSWRYYGPIEGRIVHLDRSQSGALRLTLDDVRLDRISQARTPARVRVSLHGARDADITLTPGLRVMTTGHLSPPSGPVEPGGFDFQRHAWFVGLGAVGYTRVPLLGVAPATDGHAGLAVFRLRMAASARIQVALPGDIGGLATAMTTGDRSAISQDALRNLRVSNLAHLLAISGLHMGLLSAVVFGALRLGFACVPYVALRYPVRSVAAGGALIAAAVYLALSGGNVATERAFIMVAVALCALMIGRRAISLRAVAIAATIVLILRPEALMGPGFQMSFAATTALVAVFGWMRDREIVVGPRWIRPVAAVFISSLVAGLATAPIAAAHFNQIAHYGLIANLLSVPLMGVLVMPAAVLAAALAPFGLETLGLWVMGLGLRWILGVAETVAALDGARGTIVGPGPWVLPLLALGFLVLTLWQGRLRAFGIGAMALGFFFWHGATRPDVLIADSGTLVGVMTADGRALSKPRGAGFIARNWLENDGNAATQEIAARLWSTAGDKIIHLNGKRAVAAFTGCHADQIVVASVPVERQVDCLLLDPKKLRLTGAVALTNVDGKLSLKTARAAAGARLWSNWPRETFETPAIWRDQ